MKRTIAVILIALTMQGCFNLSLGGRKAKPIEGKPQRSAEFKRDVEAGVGVIRDLSEMAYDVGIAKQSPEALALRDTARTVQMVVGMPAQPVDWRDTEELAELHERTQKGEAEYREDVADWEAYVQSLAETERLRKEKGVLSRTLAKVKFWFWVAVFIAIALCVAFPTGGTLLIKKLLSAVRRSADNRLKQIIKAVQKHKEHEQANGGAESVARLMEKLEAATDEETKAKIDELKRGI